MADFKFLFHTLMLRRTIQALSPRRRFQEYPQKLFVVYPHRFDFLGNQKQTQFLKLGSRVDSFQNAVFMLNFHNERKERKKERRDVWQERKNRRKERHKKNKKGKRKDMVKGKVKDRKTRGKK